MIKFLSTTIGVLIATVGFLYYLIQNSNFMPVDASGNYLPMNMVVFFFLLLLVLLCLTILIIFAVREFFFKQSGSQTNIKLSVKYGFLLSIGILTVYLLHFFHIINFAWGMAILIVVILSLFVI